MTVGPEDRVRITAAPRDPDEVRIYLPDTTYLDTQAYALEVGIPRRYLPELEAAIAEQDAEGPALTAAEARAEVIRLSYELYRAQDGVAFVREMCDIADRDGLEVTTARVREWLEGPECARQAGLVLPMPEPGEGR